MSYENCPFDDVNIVMLKGQAGDIVRPSDPEFQELVAAYILDNPEVLESPALESAIFKYVSTSQTIYSNYDLGQTYTEAVQIRDHDGANAVVLPTSIAYTFKPELGGILAIKFPNGIPAGRLEILFKNSEYYPVVQTNNVESSYEFKGFETSPGDIVTFMCSYSAENDRRAFVILGNNRPAPYVMADGRILNEYLPEPSDLFMTTGGRTYLNTNTFGQIRTADITGQGPPNVKSYPLFMTVRLIDITASQSNRNVSIWAAGITNRSTGVNGRGEFSGEIKVINNDNNPNQYTKTLTIDWTVTWYIYG